MDLMASLRALRRQWILTSFLVLLTFAGAVAAWVKLPGPYTTESIVVLLPSVQSSKINGNNPYLSFDGSLSIAGDVVSREVSAPKMVQELANRGYPSSFQIADDPTTSGPILDITVTGKSKSQVETTLRGVTTEVQASLTQMQQYLKPVNRITSKVLSFQTTPKLEVSKKGRTLVLVVGLGLVLTYAIPQIVEGQLKRRRGDSDTESPPPAAAGGYGPPAGEDQYGSAPYQAPHRRRYRPTTDPEPVPESYPVPTPSAERPRGVERVSSAPAPAPAGGNGTSGRRSSVPPGTQRSTVGPSADSPEARPSAAQPSRGGRTSASGVAVYPRLPEPLSDNEGRHLRDRDRHNR